MIVPKQRLLTYQMYHNAIKARANKTLMYATPIKFD